MMAFLPGAGADPFKAMMDLAQRIQSIDDAASRGRLAVDLGAAILVAQSEQAALINEKRKLEDQIRKFETWETESQRYQLQELPPGVFVYGLLTERAKPGEPFHQLCQQCYNSGRKSILHRDEQRNGVYHLTCQACEKRVTVGHFRAPIVEASYDPFDRI